MPVRPPQPPAQTPATPSLIQLCAGQCYYLWSRRAAIVLVQAGAIRLQEPPYWIASQLLDVQVDLYEGQHYLIQRSGWTCLQASLNCQLLYHPGPALGQVSRAWLAAHAAGAAQEVRRWLQRWRMPNLPGGTERP